MISKRLRASWFFLLMLCFLQSSSQVMQSDLPPPQSPLELDVFVHLWKVFEINTVEETFSIDGYFTFTWTDPRMSFDSAKYQVNKVTYYNDRIDDLRETSLYIPELEIINALGGRDIANKALTIESNGKITYVDRFRATLKHELLFHRFPFDEQHLKIVIEPFAGHDNEIIIKNVILNQASGSDPIETNGWEILDTDYYLTYSYDPDEYRDSLQLAKTNPTQVIKKVSRYSRAICSLHVKRLSGYYVWQVMFPLIIIMIASIVIFWIEDFATQIGLGFTLLLTIVAFNFFADSLLPKLPYNTYVEVLIILGYMIMLLCILLSVMLYYLSSRNKKRAAIWARNLRIIYPIILFISTFLSTLIYFGPGILKL